MSPTYKRAVVWWAIRKARETKVGAEAQLSEFNRLLKVMGVGS